jgi:hypothetical protein
MSQDLLNLKLPELREECRDRGIDAPTEATRQDLIRDIMLYDAGMKSADLEPAGYKRDEQLAQRQDELDERLDSIEEETGVHKVDPDAFEEDREILHKSIDQQMISVSNKQPGYVYAWIYYGQNSQMVWAKKAMGWEVVNNDKKDMIECIEHKEVDGTRRIGDTVLMRIREERWHRLEEDARRRKDLQYEGITSRLRDLAERGRSHGIKLHENLDDVPSGGGGTLMDVVEKRKGAAATAMQHIDQKLRDGTVPGVPAPKKK